MINIETDIFSTVAGVLRAAYPGIKVSGEYGASETNFPVVTLVESDSSVFTRARTVACIENAATVLYEANVYSNKVGYKALEAREIMATLDEEMAKLGFTRTMLSPIPNLQDNTIYRLTARYEGVVDKDLWIYQS